MQFEKVREAEGGLVTYRVEVPAEEVAALWDSKLSEVAKDFQLKGFRPGHVPRHVLIERVGPSLRKDIAEHYAARFFDDLKKEGTRTLGKARFDVNVEHVHPGMRFSFETSFYVYPKLKDVDYSSWEITYPRHEVGEEDVQEALEVLQKRLSPWTKVKEGVPAQKGHTVIVDYKGTLDGKFFKGGQGEGQRVVLGDGVFLPEIERDLLGHKVGEETDILVTFPENYAFKDLAEKKASFHVYIRGLEERMVLLEAKEVANKLELSSEEELREKLREDLQQDYEAMSFEVAKTDLLEKLYAAYEDLTIPSGLLEEEVRLYDKTLSAEKVKERLYLGIIVASLGEKWNVKLSEEDYKRAILREIEKHPGQEQKILDHYRKNTTALRTLIGPLFEEKVVKTLLERVKKREDIVSREILNKAYEEARRRFS